MAQFLINNIKIDLKTISVGLGHIAENHTVVDILSDNCNNIIAKNKNQQGALKFTILGLYYLNRLPIPPRQELRAAYLFLFIYIYI